MMVSTKGDEYYHRKRSIEKRFSGKFAKQEKSLFQTRKELGARSKVNLYKNKYLLGPESAQRK